MNYKLHENKYTQKNNLKSFTERWLLALTNWLLLNLSYSPYGVQIYIYLKGSPYLKKNLIWNNFC